jgi:hypothetical protein
VKNVTVTLDDDTIAWARVQAAERGVSLSRLLGELLEERMRTAADYDDAMRAFLRRKPVRLSRGEERPYFSRDDAHERSARDRA